jgi:hypothetical protein
MQEAQANLKQAAVEFLAAAETVAAKAAQGPADPLDQVHTDLFELGDLTPVLTAADLDDLKQRLADARLLPATVVDLVTRARQVAAVLTKV